MPLPQDNVRTYRQLAEEHHRLNRPQERDRFLLLAADAALAAGQSDEAERLRKSLLRENPNHLIRSYGTMAEALQSQDIQAYLQQLRRSFPPEKGESLLAAMTGDSPKTTTPERTATATSGVLATRSIVVKPGDRQKLLAKPAEPSPKPMPPAERIAPIPLQPLPERTVQPLPERAKQPPQERITPFPLKPLAERPAPPPLPSWTASAPRVSAATSAPAGEGSWVSTVLFVVGLALATATLGWAVARPFLN